MKVLLNIKDDDHKTLQLLKDNPDIKIEQIIDARIEYYLKQREAVKKMNSKVTNAPKFNGVFN